MQYYIAHIRTYTTQARNTRSHTPGIHVYAYIAHTRTKVLTTIYYIKAVSKYYITSFQGSESRETFPAYIHRNLSKKKALKKGLGIEA